MGGSGESDRTKSSVVLWRWKLRMLWSRLSDGMTTKSSSLAVETDQRDQTSADDDQTIQKLQNNNKR